MVRQIKRRIYPIEENCMGCRLCEVACAVEHSRTKDVISAFLGEEDGPFSHTVVEMMGPISFSLSCRHCDEPYCVEACISGALRVEDDGRVVVYEEVCVACGMCVVSCPWGAIKFRKRNGTMKAAKCDLCPDREVPACVAACPNRALIFDTALGPGLEKKEEEEIIEG